MENNTLETMTEQWRYCKGSKEIAKNKVDHSMKKTKRGYKKWYVII